MFDSDCPVCDGVGKLLGCLGNTLHFRCIQCGKEWSHSMTPQEIAEYKEFQKRMAAEESDE